MLLYLVQVNFSLLLFLLIIHHRYSINSLIIVMHFLKLIQINKIIHLVL
ncbi:unnamed protein product [Schistosoma mattheei]|uniref:Uncharacterized protein n=1 Tax=Schistosoma mattheei TaxID=31246 RepID=A0A3P8DHW3_9TREM|nr:unnamed protein product [Schistosoma mattheei]